MAILFFLICSGFGAVNSVDAKTMPTYKVTPQTKPIDKKMTKFSTYNSKTKQYYMLRSYLEKLEKTGGGKLILKKGVYTVTNTLYVPSNVTIQFENNVKVRKSNTTKAPKLKASLSIFQLVRPSKAQKKHVYGKFQGEKNIKFIGKGNATIDLDYKQKSLGIVMGHNKNIVIDHINFKNMNGGHFIELDASDHVVIKNSTFMASKHMKGFDKEAINIDTPDLNTKGFTHDWSKYDKQPNNNVLITNNRFSKLDRAIGTHKYSEGKLHNKIVIQNNTIDNIRSDAIRVMNWSNTIIEQNTLSNIGKKGVKGTTRGILVSGVVNPTIENNTFKNVPRIMQFVVWKNTGPGYEYKPIYNRLNEDFKDRLQHNSAQNVSEDFIRINNKSFGDYTYPEKIYIPIR